jgi:hypothetical protein
MISGAKMVKELANSGTGTKKLEVARAVLVANPAATGIEIHDALAKHATEHSDSGYEGTLEKCRQLLRTGEIQVVQHKQTNIEDRILGETDGPAAFTVAPSPVRGLEPITLGETDFRALVAELDRVRAEKAEAVRELEDLQRVRAEKAAAVRELEDLRGGEKTTVPNGLKESANDPTGSPVPPVASAPSVGRTTTPAIFASEGAGRGEGKAPANVADQTPTGSVSVPMPTEFTEPVKPAKKK